MKRLTWFACLLFLENYIICSLYDKWTARTVVGAVTILTCLALIFVENWRLKREVS